jgi:hypothetical protein
MAEELKKTFKCDRCSATKEIKITSGVLRIVRDPKLPTGWGIRNKNVELCDRCISHHDHEAERVYQHWFNQEFMKVK